MENFAFIGSLFLATLTCISSNPPAPTSIIDHCSKQLDVKENQDKAETIVWRSFGSDTRVAPIVEWKEGKELDCPTGRSFYGWTQNKQGVWVRLCLLGQYVSVMHIAFVAIRVGDKFSDTAFAHELCHAYFRDSDHTVCNETDANGPIRRANEALRKEGL